MATEHTLRIKTQLDTSDTERQLNRLDGAGKGGGGSSGQSLNQLLRTAGFFTAARQFESAAERINRAAGEMRSAISEAMSRIGSMGLQGFAVGGAKGGAAGLAAGGAVAAIDYFIQTITEKAQELDRQITAQNQASANANKFIRTADAATEAENFATALKTGSIPALQELKAEYDRNIEALQAQIDAAYERAKTTNQLGDNEAALLDQIQKEKAARDAITEAIEKQNKAEHQRLQNFVDTQQEIAQNRRDQSTLASGDIQVLQNALAQWQNKAAEATNLRDAAGLRQAEAMVDRYNAAIQALQDQQDKERQRLADESQRRGDLLQEARSGWLEQQENRQLLQTGNLQTIIAAVERYRKLMANAEDASQFNTAAGYLMQFIEKAQLLQNMPGVDTTDLNQRLGQLHSQGAYMGENAVGVQTEDFTRRTSETVLDISKIVTEILTSVKEQTTAIKQKDSETTLG